MNQLLTTGKAPTMTSREIAELVGKRHDNVKRTAETLAQAGVIEFPHIEEIPTATKPVAVYVFSGERGRRDSIVLVAHKVTLIGLDDVGGERLASQVRVTPKGLAVLAQKAGGAA